MSGLATVWVYPRPFARTAHEAVGDVRDRTLAALRARTGWRTVTHRCAELLTAAFPHTCKYRSETPVVSAAGQETET